MIFCEADLCIYNEDNECTSDIVEIGSSGKCYQCMMISLQEIELDMIPKEALKLIKQEYLKKEMDLWKNRTG